MSQHHEDPKEMWGGRFSEPVDAFVKAFTASVSFDQRMYRQDIAGSKAHARMLAKVGVLTQDECERIIKGLDDILFDIERGDFAWSLDLEDVHMNIEARLTERIGEAGKKLHTGRSRNDQVATDMRLYLRDEIDVITAQIRRVQKALLDLAEREVDTILPGFTHLQVAQPVSFGHHMLAWFEMFDRDFDRDQTHPFLEVESRRRFAPGNRAQRRQQPGGANRGMAGEGQFRRRGENAQTLAVRRVRRRQHEDRFREIELAGDGLHLGSGQPARIG